MWDSASGFASFSCKSRSVVSLDQAKGHLEDPLKFIDMSSLSVWDLSDIAKAGMLLRKPKIPCSFENEHEMRRVYSLIYDVFRCKWAAPSLSRVVVVVPLVPSLVIQSNRNQSNKHGRTINP